MSDERIDAKAAHDDMADMIAALENGEVYALDPAEADRLLVLKQKALAQTLADNERLERELEEMEASFNLYDSAIRRGTEKFFEAHPPKGRRVWPDAGDLIGWLLNSGLIALSDDDAALAAGEETP